MKKNGKRSFFILMLALAAMLVPAVFPTAVRAEGEVTALGEESSVTATGADDGMPEPVTDIGHLLVYEREDYADMELAALTALESMAVEEVYKPLEDDYVYDGYAPDLVLILTDQTDLSLPGGKELGINDAKKLVNHIRSAIGNDVPILWTVLAEADNAVPMAKAFGFVQEMEDSFAYPNVYANYTFYRKDEAGDRASLGRRILLPMSGRGLFRPIGEAEETAAYNDVTFYLSENGNDKAGGMSPDQPLLTGTGFVNRIRAIYGKDLKNLPVGTRIVIEVTGEIQFSKTSQTIFGIFAGTSLPRDTAGEKVPVLIETYQFNGQNRATIRGDYVPHDEGSSRICIESPTVFKNIRIATAAGANLAMHNFFITATTVVFDNTTFEARNGTGFTLSPSNNCWSNEYNVEEGTLVDTTLILKNGVYDFSTGVSYVSALNTGSLWRSADNGGSIPEGRMLRNHVIVSEGAKVGSVYALTGKLPIHSVEVVVEKGGEVENLAVSNYNRTLATYNSDVSITVKNGFISRELHGLGQQTTLYGNVTYRIEDSTVQGRPDDELQYSELLGDEGSQLNGDFDFSMKNVLFSMVCGLNAPSSIHFGGYHSGLEEGKNCTVSVEDTSFVFVPNPTLTSSDTHLAFGPTGGTLLGNYDLTLKSVLADTTEIATSDILFGAEEASVWKAAFTLGEEGDPLKGVVFYGGSVLLGGEEAYFGPDPEEETGTETVLTVKAFSPTFHNNRVSLTSWSENEERGVNGGIEAKFDGAKFADELRLLGCVVEGDLKVELSGSKMKNLLTGVRRGSEETVKVTTETGETEVVMTSAEPAQLFRAKYTINGTAADRFAEEGFDDMVNEIAFIDGVTTVKPIEPETEAEENAGKESPDGTFPWPVVIGGGAVVLLGAVLAVFLSLRKKKKA